jgi:hypothetical protein
MPRHHALLVALFVLATASAAPAQVLGPFRWQTQPFCNVLTLTATQQGGLFLLTGTDDLCGAGLAPVTGTAVVNGDGVAMGMTVALPSGAAAHLTASISSATVSGPWQDADGRFGGFQFLAGAGTGGSPRPAPASAALITSTQLSPAIFSGTGSASTVARGDHDHDVRYAPRQVRMHMSGAAGLRQFGDVFEITPECTGSDHSPDFTRLGLDVPFGASLSQVVVTVASLIGATYSLEVQLKTAGATSFTTTPILTASGTGVGAITRHTMTRITPVVIGAAQHVQLLLSALTPRTGLCAVEFVYTLPPAP